MQGLVSNPCDKSKKFGYKTTIYKTPASESKKYLELYQKSRGKHGAVQAASYEVTKDLGIPEQVSTLLAETFGILNKSGFPFEVIYKNTNGDDHKYLTTSKITRSKINMQEFALPEGLKFVSDINRVFNTSEGLDAEKYLMDY